LSSQRRRADFVVITALEVERQEVCKAFGLTDANRVAVGARVYWAGTFRLEGGETYYVVVGQLARMGQVPSALDTADAIKDWQPTAALLVGIAGAAHDEVALGDVVVGSDVYYYEQGKVMPDGTAAQPAMLAADDRLLARVAALPAWQPALTEPRPEAPDGGPRRHVAVIATGEKVIADATFRTALREKHRKIRAIEMEAWGFTSAVLHSGRAVHHLCIRGISDDATPNKGDLWHRYAAAAAADFARHLIASRPVDPLPKDAMITGGRAWLDRLEDHYGAVAVGLLGVAVALLLVDRLLIPDRFAVFSIPPVLALVIAGILVGTGKRLGAHFQFDAAAFARDGAAAGVVASIPGIAASIWQSPFIEPGFRLGFAAMVIMIPTGALWGLMLGCLSGTRRGVSWLPAALVVQGVISLAWGALLGAVTPTAEVLGSARVSALVLAVNLIGFLTVFPVVAAWRAGRRTASLVHVAFLAAACAASYVAIWPSVRTFRFVEDTSGRTMFASVIAIILFAGAWIMVAGIWLVARVEGLVRRSGARASA
jgi:nucleoside phosphorylase